MINDTLTIHSLNPTGMFSYGRSDAIPLLNKGLVHVIGVNEDQGGDSNGAGKSSLFNAICELLFQENPTGAKSDDVCNSVWGKGMAGRITFTAKDGCHYRITYCRNWKGSFYEVDNDNNISYCGTALYLDKYNKDSRIWMDARGPGMPETKKKIKQIIGITYQRFLAISYMSHRVGNQFLKGTNKDRMDLLSGIIGIEEWDEILNKCRKEKKGLKAQVESITNKISYEDGAVQTLREQLQNIRVEDVKMTIERLKEEAEEKRDEWLAKSSIKKQVDGEYTALQAEQKGTLDDTRIDSLNKEESSLNIELSTLERSRTAQQVTSDTVMDQDRQKKYSEMYQIEAQLNVATSSHSDLLDLDNCPTCENEITEDQKSKIQTIKESAITTLTSQLEELKVLYAEATKKVEEDLGAKQVAENKRQEDLYIKSQELQARLQKINEERTKEYETYRGYEGKLKEIQDRINVIVGELAEIKAAGSNKVAEADHLQSKLDDIDVLKAQIEEKQKNVLFFRQEIAGFQDDLDDYLWLIDHIPSVKLHKMSNAMEEISNLVNDYFISLGDSLRVNISPFKAKIKPKDASDVKSMMKDEVTVKITDGAKDILPILYSDGELSKVSLAISKALHEMARKSGQGCNLMMMDEIFGFMDANNSQRISQSLSGILNRGTVFLTDNSDKVRDLVNFKHVWTAKKTNGQTKLEVS